MCFFRTVVRFHIDVYSSLLGLPSLDGWGSGDERRKQNQKSPNRFPRCVAHNTNRSDDVHIQKHTPFDRKLEKRRVVVFGPSTTTSREQQQHYQVPYDGWDVAESSESPLFWQPHGSRRGSTRSHRFYERSSWPLFPIEISRKHLFVWLQQL